MDIIWLDDPNNPLHSEVCTSSSFWLYSYADEHFFVVLPKKTKNDKFHLVENISKMFLFLPRYFLSFLEGCTQASQIALSS